MDKHGVHALRQITAGAVFGCSLLGAGMHNPATIKAQMQLADFRMVEVMLIATAVSALTFYASNRSGFTRISPKQSVNLGLFPYDGNVIGGALLGIGMAVTGACPGSAIVQAGTGVISGVYTTLGGIVGAMLYVGVETMSTKRAAISGKTSTRNPVARLNARSSGPTPEHKHTLAASITTSLNTKPATMVVIWQMFVLATVVALRTFTNPPDPEAKSSVTGGLLMGLAQLASVVLTRSTLGASRAYEDVARNMLGPVLGARQKILTQAVLSASGVLFAVQATNTLFLGHTVSPASASWTHVMGGAVMLFGSRLAKGCASGHGISGIPTFGWASFITIASALATAVPFTAVAMP